MCIRESLEGVAEAALDRFWIERVTVSDDGKGVAGKARDELAGAEEFAQVHGGRSQQEVAVVMPENIVDRGKLIDVDDRQNVLAMRIDLNAAVQFHQ